uniref:Neurotransmitter-gated ion-channel ligand-binding domain-containing protein n=1 Tax=Romanomermis culicivorax TaxID=13658 RepID=A0A915KLR9_ROMCU
MEEASFCCHVLEKISDCQFHFERAICDPIFGFMKNIFFLKRHEIRTVIEISEFRIQMTFRQEWIDKRLAYYRNSMNDPLPAFLVVPENLHDVIWKPDTFFQNEIETKLHNFDKPNRLIRVYPDGAVLMSTSLLYLVYSQVSDSQVSDSRVSDSQGSDSQVSNSKVSDSKVSVSQVIDSQVYC